MTIRDKRSTNGEEIKDKIKQENRKKKIFREEFKRFVKTIATKRREHDYAENIWKVKRIVLSLHLYQDKLN